jgi:hypothetical protein
MQLRRPAERCFEARSELPAHEAQPNKCTPHHHAEDALCVGMDRAPDEKRLHGGIDIESGLGVGHPAGQEPGHGPPGGRAVPEVPDPRPGLEGSPVPSTRCSAQRAWESSSPRSERRTPTRSANDGWGPFGPSAWTGPSSSADGTWSESFIPTFATRTRRGPIEGSVFGRRSGARSCPSVT